MGASDHPDENRTEPEDVPAELLLAIRRGWRVFPCGRENKIPRLKEWQKFATNGISRIRSWLQQHRNCNWAAVTGSECSFFVLDVDGPQGADSLSRLVDEGNSLPATLTATTSRGRHLYFLWPNGTNIRNSAGRLGEGLDIRGNGGYVIIPPSIHPSGHQYAYESKSATIAPAPKWLIERLIDIENSRSVASSDAFTPILEGQRHSYLMSVGGLLRNKGMGYEAIFEALTAENQRCSPPLLVKEVKSIARSAAGYPLRSAPKTIPKRRPDIVRLSEIQPAPVNWLWKPYLPLGMLAMLSGDPSSGKTYASLAIGASYTVGQVPCRDETCEPADVLYLTVENSLPHVIRPRFDSLGGNPDRFYLLRGALSANEEEKSQSFPVTLSDVNVLEETLQSTKARLVVIDPIQSYLGSGVDFHRSNETRPILDGLGRLAEKHSCCVLLVRHISKASTNRAIHRGLGSIDFTGAVRSELLVGSDPEDPNRRALVHIKSNVGQLGSSVGFVIDNNGLRWTGESSLTAAAILSPEPTSDRVSAMKEATEFLTQALAKGARPAKDLYEQAAAMGISPRTLKRAKAQLGVKSQKGPGMDQPWEWRLPEEGQA
jgi:hypothetical protein